MPSASNIIEAHVECGGAVGEPADRDQVDAGGGNGGRGCRRDTARGLGDRPAADDGNGPAELFGQHVVEQHRIDAGSERLLQLGERIDLDLDLDQVADAAARAPDGRLDAAGRRNVVVLDEHRVVEAEAVV